MGEVPEKYIRTDADRKAIQEGAYWDQEQVDKLLTFIETYVSPQFVQGNKFKLLEWQADWLSQVVGWRLADGRTRWRKILLQVSKKNGKSLLTSALCMWFLLASGSLSPVVISTSTTIKNASQIFDTVQFSIKRNPKLDKVCQCRRSSRLVRVPKINGEFQSISSDAGNAEGLNILFGCLDEVHAWPQVRGERLYRTLEYGTIARDDGCLCIISTPGADQSHFFYDLVSKAKNVLSGADTDTSFFANIFECPQGQEETPAGWRQANPSLDVLPGGVDEFAKQLEAAKKNLPDWCSFRRYRLGQWVQSSASWLSLDKWDRAKAEPDEDRLKFNDCWLACDASATTDPTSVALCWHLGGREFFLRVFSWVCREGVHKRQKSNLPKYEQFAGDGWLTITDGDVIDQQLVKQFILDACAKYQVREIVFDSHNAMLLASELVGTFGENFVYTAPQNARFYNSPCKSFEMDLAEGRLHHDGNRFLRWAVQNARLKSDAWGNVQIDRANSQDKIDPVVASVMAYARAAQFVAENQDVESVYNNAPVFKF
jgi:phage terminase large subunit-like protein